MYGQLSKYVIVIAQCQGYVAVNRPSIASVYSKQVFIVTSIL